VAFARLSLPAALGWVGTVAGRVIGRIVRRSDAVVYVSERSLQALYPAKVGVPTMARSNVRVPDGWQTGSRGSRGTGAFTVVTVGALAATTKGIDVLLEAVSRVSGEQVTVVVVGEGQLKTSYIALAKQLGVDARFVGQVDDSAELARLLDQSSLYVCASRTEGLSRAMVEAMARGLPVVSTDVGAARELIADVDAIVPSEDSAALATAIERMRDDSGAWERNSAANAARAAEIISAADPHLLTAFLQELVGRR
jgi:glycosyltransferase involved in cell wall biosynthesis